jgi:predicted ATPase/DNA-binding SARP family transcriptional activator
LIRITMRFLVLGPLEVVSGDRGSLPLGGRKQRRLLALLLLHANRVVERDQLMESAWGNAPPPSARESLDAYVYRLRQLLGHDRIARQDGGYRLRIGPGELDVDEFEQLVARAGEAIEAGEHRAATAALEQALGLCRGAAWAELDGDLSALSDAHRIDEIRISATEAMLEARLALGIGAELVSELEQLHREYPLRERPLSALMLALYRAGRQTEALASYRELCGVLREELGLQPSEPLRALERAILRQDPSLSTPPPQPRAPAAGHLPVPATPFLGRARELAEVTALLRGAGARLVTLTGAGGSGKTRLALRVAEACGGEYRRTCFVGFADLTDPGLIAATICQALGIVERPDLTPAERLEGYLRDRELLLVLDNLEQLAPEVGVLGELLGGCPGVRMLVTSREPLHLAGEQQYEVPVLDPEEAIELFIARARTVIPSLLIERESAGAVCERLDRLPLAIELAAARIKVLSPAEILHRLERRLPVLASGPRDAPRRQRTLQATIDWSYGLLNEEEQRLLARLSVFAGGCTLQAAEAVCEAELDALGALIDRSLLRADGHRYGMLQTLREYALEKLARSGEEDLLRRRHAQFFIELLHAHRLDECLPDVDPRRPRGVVEADERENFRAALEWAMEAGEIETVARLAAPLTLLWVRQGRLSEADRWLVVARERSTAYPLPLQGLLLTGARELACARGAHQESADLCDQALAIYRQLGDPGGLLLETTKRAAAAGALGDLGRSHALLEEALAIEREHDLKHAHAHTLVHVAGSHIAEGRFDQARTVLEEALLATEVGSGARVLVQVNLAYIANVERRHTDAGELAEEAFQRGFAIGQSAVAAAAALELAWSLAELHQPERATRILGAALEFYRDAGTFMQSDEADSEQAIRDAVGAQLDERTFQALLNEGSGMTVEQAVREERQRTEQPA